MANTRHYGMIGIAGTTIAQALAAACGDTTFTDALSTGNISLIVLTFADFIIARLKKVK